MELNNENYYSLEANQEYMSVHQFYSFVPSFGLSDTCEAKAMAVLNGEWKDETTEAMLVGSYVDAAIEGTLEEFKKTHPECFLKNGNPKAAFVKAENMIDRISQDDLFMKYMSGNKQTIMTAEMFGCKWKIKMDSYIPGKAIVDLKTTANIHKSWWIPNKGRVSFVEYYRYITQLAIYQEVVRINTGYQLPCYIAAVSKEDEPDMEIIYIDQDSLDEALEDVRLAMPSVIEVWEGRTKPIRCEKCNYCRRTRKITSPIHYMDLVNEVD